MDNVSTLVCYNIINLQLEYESQHFPSEFVTIIPEGNVLC